VEVATPLRGDHDLVCRLDDAERQAWNGFVHRVRQLAGEDAA
jgi:hypothetical protein